VKRTYWHAESAIEVANSKKGLGQMPGSCRTVSAPRFRELLPVTSQRYPRLSAAAPHFHRRFQPTRVIKRPCFDERKADAASAVDVTGEPQSEQKFRWTGFPLSAVSSNVFRVPSTVSAALGTLRMTEKDVPVCF